MYDNSPKNNILFESLYALFFCCLINLFNIIGGILVGIIFFIFFLIIFIDFLNGCFDDSELKKYSPTEEVKERQKDKDTIPKTIVPLNLLERFSSSKTFLLFFIILISIYTVWYEGNIKNIIWFISSVWIFCLAFIYISLIKKIDKSLILGIGCVEKSDKSEYKKEVGEIREKLYKYFEIAIIIGFIIFLASIGVAFNKKWVINESLFNSFIGIGTVANLISVISGLNSLDSLLDALLWKYDEKSFLYYQIGVTVKTMRIHLSNCLKK
jgi:hypothetical protein